jgi:hypothetical protein
VSLKNKIKSILRESFVNEQDDENFTLYKALKLWIRDKITLTELEGADDSISRVKFRHGHRGETEIIFELTDYNEFFELLDISEDDGYFARAVTDTYSSGFEFDDSYQIEDDFKQGYIIYGDLDADNSEMIKEIILLLTGKSIDVNEGGPEIMSEYSVLLLNTFPDEMDRIISEYTMCRRDEMNITARESITEELDDFMTRIGFKIYQKFDYISTTPANLIMWYSKFGDKTLTFKELFQMIVEDSDTRHLGGWTDVQYEFRDENNFDSSEFNRVVNRQLESILDEINSDGSDFEKFKEMVEEVTKKYEINKWYNLPKDRDYMFKVKSFDKENMKIKIVVSKSTGWREKPLSFTLDGLNKFLNHPDLFGLSDLIPESIKETFDLLHFLKKKFSKKDERAPSGGLESVNKYGDDFQKVVDLIFKKAIKEYPVEHLKGLKVTSVYPQQLVSNDMRGENKIRWNVRLVPVVPDWFNYQKNLGFIHNCIKFDDVFRKYSRYMGIESSPPASVKGNPNYVENPDELHNYISFDLVVKKFVTF